MFIKLNHKDLEVYKTARELVKEINHISLKLPVEEKFNMVQQIRGAALSVQLNLAEGASRKSGLERSRYLKIARGSVIEIDAALETAVDLHYLMAGELNKTGILLNRCFAILSKLIVTK